MAKIVVTSRAEYDIPEADRGYSIAKDKLLDFLNQLPDGATLSAEIVKGSKMTLVAKWSSVLNG